MKKILLTLAIFLIAATLAHAHKVSIFAWVEQDTIYTISKFSGGKYVKHGKVSVFDEHENQLLEGTTDDKGEFSFKVPEKTTLKIVLDASAGHGSSWTIPLSEILGENGETPQQALEKAEINPAAQAMETPEASSVSQDQIQQAVEAALDKKLRPVLKMLAEQKEKKPGLVDIFGGIGYILGLAGIGAYFHYRGKIRDLDKS